MSSLEYKGYQGSIEVDVDTGFLHGKIQFVRDLVTYEAETVPGLKQEFEAAVDDYLETCFQLGRSPQQPFSGQFNVRVGESLHRAAANRALRDGVKLNAVVVDALEHYLTDKSVNHTHNHNVTVKVTMSDVKSLEPRTYSSGQWFVPEQIGTESNVTH